MASHVCRDPSPTPSKTHLGNPGLPQACGLVWEADSKSLVPVWLTGRPCHTGEGRGQRGDTWPGLYTHQKGSFDALCEEEDMCL